MAAAVAMPRGEMIPTTSAEAGTGTAQRREPEGLTMVIFSGEFDRMIAGFIIANGAAAMDMPVTMFFTFWGLNALRRDASVPPATPKTMTERMFGAMMPRGAGHLKLSKLNMAGLGMRMMKREMVKKHVMDLPSLIRSAQEQGVRLIACEMTMNLMGIKREELIPGVGIGGVASMLASADDSRSTLFI